jgi:hypothetical protein
VSALCPQSSAKETFTNAIGISVKGHQPTSNVTFSHNGSPRLPLLLQFRAPAQCARVDS